MEAMVLGVQINKCNVQIHMGVVVKRYYLEEHKSDISPGSDFDCRQTLLQILSPILLL